MGEEKSVLVATDLGARADRAVDRAILLAREWGLRAGVMHVLHPTHLHSNQESAFAATRAVLPDWGGEAEIMLRCGPVPQTIISGARECGARLIVVAPARFNQVRDYFLGTAVDSIVRLADRPVLVVKQRPHRPYARLMIACDLSSHALQVLLEAADLFPDAELNLVHAYHIPYGSWIDSDRVRKDLETEARADLDAFAADADIPDAVRARLRLYLDCGDVDTVVDRALRTLHPDLLVLGTHGVSGYVQAAIGSTAAALLNWAPIDTLMICRRP